MIGHLFLAWILIQAVGSAMLLAWWVVAETR